MQGQEVGGGNAGVVVSLIRPCCLPLMCIIRKLEQL